MNILGIVESFDLAKHGSDGVNTLWCGTEA